MARPSGLASDHHPEGPGDAPRRRKARRSTPPPDTQHNSKRAASSPLDASSPATKRVRIAVENPEDLEDLYDPEESDDLDDQLARELQESVKRQSVKPQSQTPSTILVRKNVLRHTRRNSDPVVAFADEEEDEEEDELQATPTASTQPLPGLTPHLTRIGAPRGRPTNAARRARMSMPAQIRPGSVDAISGSQIQFAPFKATIDSRTRRRLKRNHLAEEYNDLEYHQKEDRRLRKAYVELSNQLKEKSDRIKELEYQIEARRLGEINSTERETNDLRNQLAQARDEIEELRASSVYRGDSGETDAFDTGMDIAFDDDDYDEEPLLAIDPNDPDGPDMDEAESLENGPFASRVMALSSQVTVDSLRTISHASQDHLGEASQDDPTAVPDKISDQAVKRYEHEIGSLIEQVARAQGALRVMTIELQNANLLPPGASADEILLEQRMVFQDIREEMENLIPGCSLRLNNSEFLRKLPTLFEGLLSELGEKTTVAEKHFKEARVMRAQFENALGLLERSEARNDALDDKIADLQQGNEVLRVDIADLEERVTTLDALSNQQDAELKQKDTEIHGLQDEIEDKETALTRLRDSLEKYRVDLESVTQTATRTEAEYQEAMAKLGHEHAAEILDIQAQLQDENELRLQAQGQAEQKSEYIEELEEKVQNIEQQVADLLETLEQLRDRLATEEQGHDQDKLLLDAEQARADAQHAQIENLEEKLEELMAELDNTRANLDTEHAQRQEAEALLDAANTQIEDLKERLSAEGLESQGLRSKLFQVQMEREEVVKNLEQETRERTDTLQEQLGLETQARVAAEKLVAELTLQITQLEADIAARDETIAQLTQELADTEKDRDAQVADLEAQLTALQQQYAALDNTTSSEIATLSASITDLTNEVNAQTAVIDRLTADAADTERDLREQLAQKEQEITLRNQMYSELESKYTELDGEHSRAIESFSNEQFHFNRLQQKWIRGQQTMEEKIRNLEGRIRDLETALAQQIQDHEAILVKKEIEIQELHVLADARAETVVQMQSQLDDLKESFAQQELDSRQTIDALLDAQRLVQQQNEDLAAGLKKRNADTLDAVQALRVKGVVIKKQNTNLNKVANGKITKVSERVKIGKKNRVGKIAKERKWRDSGFGADSDIENEEVDFDEAEPEPIAG